MYSTKRVLLTINISLLSASCFSQTDLSRLPDINGKIRFDHFSYFKNIDKKINTRNQTIINLDLKKDYSNSGFYSSLEFREDLSDQSRNRVYVKESYLDLTLKALSFRFGKQIISWGKGDAVNPTNNLNPVDYSDILDTDNETIGVFGVNSKVYLSSDFTIQGVFIPVFQSNIYSTDYSSRWFLNPVDIFTMQYPVAKYSASFSPSELPKNDLSNAQYAVKFDVTIKGWDFSANYYDGTYHSPSYNYIVTPITNDSVTIQIDSKYFGVKTIGFDFTTSLLGFGIRGEAAYYIPEGYDKMKTNYLRYVIGLDKSIGIGYSHRIAINVDWTQEVVEDNFEYSHFDVRHLFQETLITQIKYDFGPTASFSFKGAYNTDNKDYYLAPEVKYNLADGFNLFCTFDLLDGDDGGFFTYFNNNNRFRLKLQYDF
jgi:hypothetical protein